MIDPQTKTCIENFLKKCDEIAAELFLSPVHQVEYGEKWAKVYRYELRGDKLQKTCIYAFICLQDFTNTTLGVCKMGDIHKPASYKAPAKHARGSVYAIDFNNCIGAYGISYMK